MSFILGSWSALSLPHMSECYTKLLLLGPVWLMQGFMHGYGPASPSIPAAWTGPRLQHAKQRDAPKYVAAVQIVCPAMQDAEGQLSGVLPDLPSNGRYEYRGNS